MYTYEWIISSYKKSYWRKHVGSSSALKKIMFFILFDADDVIVSTFMTNN